MKKYGDKAYLYLILFFLNIYYTKSDYAILELNTYKNKSNYNKEQINYFYDSLYNILYSEISISSSDIKYIMEIKTDSLGFTIYNYNCDIPPINKELNPPLLPNFANSKIIEHIDTNDTQIYGEYFAYILNNTLKINTNNGEKNIFIDYIFSQRNDTNYLKNVILRPYTCFNLGFHLITNEIEDDIASNLIFQLKKKNLIDSYNWFIEYDSNNNKKAKLILGSKPYEYDNKKYQEENEKTIEVEKRLDRIKYWDLKMDEIYIMQNNEKLLINDYNKCSLEPNLGVIIGTIGYKNLVEEKLFQPLIEQNKCFKEKILSNKYIIFYCDINAKDSLEKSEYVKIYFNHRFLGNTFELNFNDLFEEKNNFIYFKIFFDEGSTDLWKFGKPFLIKYFFSYDFDKKTISYYNINNITNNNENNNIKIVLIVIIVVLALAFLTLGFLFGRYLYMIKKSRKLSAEELINEENIGRINTESNKTEATNNL